MRSLAGPGLRGLVRVMSIIGFGQSRTTHAALRSSLNVVAISSLLAICAASLVPGEFRPHTTILPSALEHVAAYGVAAFLLRLAYHRRLSLIRLVLLLTAYGASLELGQLWVPGRHGQLSDVMADFAGASIGVLVASAFLHLRRMAAAR
jgi:VanZ family protein